MGKSKRMSIKKIVSIEPQIKKVLDDAAKMNNADWPDYSRFKQKILPLVGNLAEKEAIRNSGAYVTVINALCDALKI
jgi:hypothetical protein